MMNNQSEIIAEVSAAIQKQFEGEGTGHDWWHIHRVVEAAKTIASKEGGDLFIIELAALVHDVGDHKFNDGKVSANEQIADLLEDYVDHPTIVAVIDIVSSVSYKGAGVETIPSTLEGKIVQDADRLDALGAIGIARCFAYGGYAKQPIHDPKINQIQHASFEDYKSAEGTSINHFYEKLLLLKDRFQTGTGKAMAKERHEVMEQFLTQFYGEWEGER